MSQMKRLAELDNLGPLEIDYIAVVIWPQYVLHWHDNEDNGVASLTEFLIDVDNLVSEIKAEETPTHTAAMEIMVGEMNDTQMPGTLGILS